MDQQEGPSGATVELTKKLTEWVNEPDVTALKQDLQDAQPAHDFQVMKIDAWLEALHVKNKPAAKGTKNSRIQPKLVRKQAEWRYPSLSEPFLSEEDLFKSSPRTWDDRLAAEQNQTLLNYQVNTFLDRTAFIDEYVRTAVDEGTVICKTSWCFEEEVEDKDVPNVQFVKDPSYLPMIQHLHQMGQDNPAQYHGEVPDELKQAHQMSLEHDTPIRPDILGFERKKVSRTTKNHPMVEVCDYRNVIIDPAAFWDIDKAKFVIHSFPTSLADLKKSSIKYKNLDQIQVTQNSILGEPDHTEPEQSGNFNYNDQQRKRFIAFEYWGFYDINNTGLLEPIVATWVGNVMIRMDINPYPDKKLPFVVERYMPKRRSAYGEPDAELLEDNQKVVGALTRGMIDIMGKSANGQTGIRKDMLDVTNKKKWLAGEDYEYNPNIDPRQGVFMHTFNDIPQSAQFMLQLQQQEAESMTGVKSFSQGVTGTSLGDVAAGVRGALDASSKRELNILRRLANGIVKIGHKFIAMNSQFLSESEVVRVTNEKFVVIKRDDLAGNIDLKLSITTAEENDKKAQELAFMLQTMGNNMDPEMSKMILSDIARLRKMPDLAKKIEEYAPQPDPLAQQKAMLEIQLLQAQIANLGGQRDLNESQAQLNEAKLGSEGSKAKNLDAQTDKLNLDYVEQESGTKQERELQLAGAQAHANAQAEASKLGLSVQAKQSEQANTLQIQREQQAHEQQMTQLQQRGDAQQTALDHASVTQQQAQSHGNSMQLQHQKTQGDLIKEHIKAKNAKKKAVTA